jgi:hypothetical protein
MRMIRKQVYLGESQQRKVRLLAGRRGCTEAEVIRMAIDRLPNPDGSIEERLAEAGVLVPSPDDSDVPTGAAADKLEQDVIAWLETLEEPLGLSEAVLEDRR